MDATRCQYQGVYDATSCLVPCSFQGYDLTSYLVSCSFQVGVWSWGVWFQGEGKGGLVLGEGVCFRGRGMALPPPGGQTNGCINITFPHFCLRAVTSGEPRYLTGRHQKTWNHLCLSFFSVADLHSKTPNFMQFLGNYGKIVCWRLPSPGLAPSPWGIPGSATAFMTYFNWAGNETSTHSPSLRKSSYCLDSAHASFLIVDLDFSLFSDKFSNKKNLAQSGHRR